MRQTNSKVPQSRELVLDCMLQHHTKCTQGKRKAPRNENPKRQRQESTKTTRFLLGIAKYKESATQRISAMCHECTKATRLLLGVAKNKESTTQRISSMSHGCAKTPRLLLGVTKYKE